MIKFQVLKQLSLAQEKADKFTAFDCPINIYKASKEELYNFLKNHDKHCDRGSYQFANNIKIHSLGLDRETRDALYDALFLPDEFPFECQMFFDDEISNFEWDKNIKGTDYTIQCEGRSGGWLVLTKKKGHVYCNDVFYDIENAEDEDNPEEELRVLREWVKIVVTFDRYCSYIVKDCIYYAMTHKIVDRKQTIIRNIKASVCIACEDKGTIDYCYLCGKEKEEELVL